MNRNRIWVVGGTSDSRAVVNGLLQAKVSIVVTVVSESARSLYPAHPLLQVVVGAMTADSADTFLQQWQVSRILDASHPHAIEISRLAISLAQSHQIPYLRYERPSHDLNDHHSPYLTTVETIDAVITEERLQHQRVLLTLGYRWLPLFEAMQQSATLFTRILPSPIALQTALESGFTADRIIALRPPVTYELEKALWQQWQISCVVTKASGAPGGEQIKRQLATELKIPLLIIARPTIAYPQQTDSITVAVAFCQEGVP